MGLGDDDAEQQIADGIAQCCLSLYDSLPRKGAKPGIRSDGRFEWSILAGAVLQIDKRLVCISLTTGVKALPYESLSPHGDLLHDSHAEVLARRGARNWFLKRLMQEACTHDEIIDDLPRIYDKIGEDRWRLSEALRLHLYCSTFPCGDGSNFLILHNGANRFNHSETHSQSTRRGRNGVSNVNSLTLRTKPGKLQSLPSISMSCTDKLAFWSAVGMQGSLLSRWIEPIFFSRVIIGQDGVDLATESRILSTVHDCQSVFDEKIRSIIAKPVKVCGTTRSFTDSREAVKCRLLTARPSAKVDGPGEELDLVPAAGSLVWILGEKIESIVDGKRQGAALPRNTKEALGTSNRSQLSKRSYYSSILDSEKAILSSDQSENLTYHDAKHKCQSDHVMEYRAKKRGFRGSPTLEEEKKLVTNFLFQARPLHPPQEPCEISMRSKSSGDDAPFQGWLVCGSAFESFTCKIPR